VMGALALAVAALVSATDAKTEALAGWQRCLTHSVERYAGTGEPWEVVWKAARSDCREWKIKYWLATSSDYSRYPKVTGYAKAARDAQDMEELLEGEMAREFLLRR